MVGSVSLGRLCRAITVSLCLTGPFVFAGEPLVQNINIRGLQIDGTVTVVIDGDQLGKSPQLLLPFPSTQELQTDATDKRATLVVKLPPEVTPGLYQTSLVSEEGVSLPWVIGVDRLPQIALPAKVEQLPTAIYGNIGGSTVAKTVFAGQAGQQVLVEVEAQRLGGKLRPVLHLIAPTGRQISWAWTTPALAGDTRLSATLPVDGEYTVTLHDVEYATPGPGFFRLKIGRWSQIDQVFPMTATTGVPQHVEYIGASPLAATDLPPLSQTGAFPLPWPGEGLWSGPRPFLRIRKQPELVEAAPPTGLQELPSGQVGLNGRLLTAREEDRYLVPVLPGSKLHLEVWAERIGSPVDTAIIVQNEQGGVLARSEESPGSSDPILDYNVPGNVSTVVVAVAETQGRGGPQATYRLTVEPQNVPIPARDFTLSSPTPRITLPVDGRVVMPIWIERQGYSGPIEITAHSLPAGVKLTNNIIAGNCEGTLVSVERTEGFAAAGLSQWVGRSTKGQEHAVITVGQLLEHLQPWLANELAIAPSSKPASEFQIDWRDLAENTPLVPGGKLPLPVKLVRPMENSLVRLTLLTNQLPILANNQPVPNRNLRAEQAVELAANVAEGTILLAIPNDLPAPSYEFCIQAELLTPDRRLVLASAYTPIRRFSVQFPVALQLSQPAKIDVPYDAKAGSTVAIKGQLVRQAGFMGDAPLTITGLPPGAQMEPLTVKADATEFELKLILPGNLPAGEWQGLKLSTTVTSQSNVPVKCADVELVLNLQPAS